MKVIVSCSPITYFYAITSRRGIHAVTMETTMLAQRLNLMVKIVQVPQLMLLCQILWHKFSFFTLFLSNIVSYIYEL